MDQYQITFQTWDALVQWYEENIMNLDIYNQSYDSFCELINKENASILELACGPGNVTKYLISKQPDYNILASDISKNMLDAAKKNCPQAQFQQLDVRELNTINQQFDGIVAGFCLPYLSQNDSIKLIKDAYTLLNKKGVIYLSCIEDNYSKSAFQTNSKGQQSLQFFHEFEFLNQNLIQHGFNLQNVIRVPYPNKENPIASHLIVIAQKAS